MFFIGGSAERDERAGGSRNAAERRRSPLSANRLVLLHYLRLFARRVDWERFLIIDLPSLSLLAAAGGEPVVSSHEQPQKADFWFNLED